MLSARVMDAQGPTILGYWKTNTTGRKRSSVSSFLCCVCQALRETHLHRHTVLTAELFQGSCSHGSELALPCCPPRVWQGCWAAQGLNKVEFFLRKHQLQVITLGELGQFPGHSLFCWDKQQHQQNLVGGRGNKIHCSNYVLLVGFYYILFT